MADWGLCVHPDIVGEVLVQHELIAAGHDWSRLPLSGDVSHLLAER